MKTEIESYVASEEVANNPILAWAKTEELIGTAIKLNRVIVIGGGVGSAGILNRSDLESTYDGPAYVMWAIGQRRKIIIA